MVLTNSKGEIVKLARNLELGFTYILLTGCDFNFLFVLLEKLNFLYFLVKNAHELILKKRPKNLWCATI